MPIIPFHAMYGKCEYNVSLAAGGGGDGVFRPRDGDAHGRFTIAKLPGKTVNYAYTYDYTNRLVSVRYMPPADDGDMCYNYSAKSLINV